MATDAELLQEAKDALHNLLTGKRAVVIGYGERRVEFTAGNIDELRKYIAELEGKVDSTKARKPFRLIW